MEERIGSRQLLVLAFLTVLSPVVRLLPGAVLKISGAAGWLSPLPAAAAVALHVLLLTWLFSKRRGGEGLTGISRRAFGGLLGRLLPLITAVWLVFYTGIVTRAAAERLVSIVYPGGAPALFILVMLAAVLITLLGRMGSLCRAAEIVLPIILGCLIFVFIFSVGGIKLRYLLPVGSVDAAGAVLGAAPILENLGLWAYFLFAGNCIKDGGSLKKEALIWSLAAVAGVFALMLITVGTLAPELASRLLSPALTVIRNIRVFGTDARVDAIIVAVWIVTDFALLASLTHIAKGIVSGVFPGIKAAPLSVGIVAAAAVSAFLISETAFGVDFWSKTAAPAVNVVMTWGVIPATLALGALRAK